MTHTKKQLRDLMASEFGKVKVKRFFKEKQAEIEKLADADGNFNPFDVFALYKKTHLEDVKLPKNDENPAEYIAGVAQELGDAPSYSEARTFQVIYQGKLAQLKYEIEKGNLVNRKEVEIEAFRIARQVRDHLLAIPERVAGELASLSSPSEVRERLYEELIKAMEALEANEPVS